METTPKAITNIHRRWLGTALAIGSALAMTLATPAFAMGPAPTPTPTPTPAPTITSGDKTGTVGVALSYQITANQTIPNGNWGATNKPPGLTGPSNNGSISGTPTTAGTYNNVILSATNANGTGTKTVTFTINPAPTPTPTPTPHTAPTSTAAISPTAVWEGDTVTLDGTGSHTNPSGGTLDYLWQQQAPASPALALSPNSTTNFVTFLAPTVPLPALTQAVTFRLKVTDNLASGGDKNTMSDAVTTTVYASPGADAEPKGAHVNEATVVQLNGSATRVQPGATFSYTWTAPAGITFSDTNTQNSNLQNPTFTAPLVGVAGSTLTFTLVVTEHLAAVSAHDQDSAPNSVTINVDNVNAPPTAQASAVDENDPAYPKGMAEVPENTDPVTLYGFGSDPDNDAISFTWTQVHDTTGAALLPDDTVVFLSDNTSASPIFTAPNLTTQDHVDLVFQLTTYDGHLSSGPSYVTIRVNNTNNPPLAVPTVSPLSALEGDLVTLDGSGSYDPNNTPGDPNHDTLTYTWTQSNPDPNYPFTLNTNPADPIATFIAPTVSNAQGSVTLTFNLTVDDGNGGTDTKPVSITVSHRNLPPVAIASATGTVPEGETALLDGSTSYDPEGDSVTFAWAQLDGPDAGTLTPVTPDNSKMSFVAPDVGAGGGVAHFKLTVSDGHIPPSTATVAVNITYVNQPPTANAGNEQNLSEGDTVNLSGSGSDPDNNPLTFMWSYVSGPAIILNVDPSDSSKATFLAPQVLCAGDIVVMKLTVDDGFGGIATQDVNINVANVNHAPTADAGGNQTNISEGGAVELHGTGDDTDTEEASDLTFQWTQVPQIGEPAVTLLPSSGKDVGFTAPTIGGGDPNAFVDLHFSLTVMDNCNGSTTTDPITVHVANIPHAPVAVAQGPTTANEGGDNVTLDGTGSSDPDFDPLIYVWTQCGGPAVTLVYSPGDILHKMPMFITPWVSADTDVKFKLTVSDFPGSSSSAYVTVKILNWNQLPDVTNAHADVPVLWPPDHKMIQVHILGVNDAQNNAAITINSVTQDERTNGLGDGDTPVDAVISGDSVLLRAERSGQGNGRVYKVCFTAADPEGSVNGCFNVMVPKSKKTDVAIDNGQTYDSTH